MKEKKYQVFISSTYTDLIEERRKVLDILLMADCIPAGMEAFVATDNDQFEVIKKVIDLCDYYILILGMRYGSINPSTGISYTEMEYEYAKGKGIPVLVFAIDDSIDLPEEKIETDAEKLEKLKAFRNSALTNRLASIWKNIDELTGKVAVSIMRAKSEIERPGWQRAVDYDEASLRKQIMDLSETNKKLKEELDEANKTIEMLITSNDVSYESCVYDIKYSYTIYRAPDFNGRRQSQIVNSVKSIPLPQIFESVAIEMMDIMISENIIEKVIKNLIDSEHIISFDDKQLTKRILNQLRRSNLIYSSWSEKNHSLFWGLTKKGIKLRDDKTLIKDNK